LTVIEDFLNSALYWLTTNLWNIIFAIIILAVVYVFYNFSYKQINRFRDEGKIDETISFLLSKALRWGSILFVLAFIIAQFGIRIDLMAGLLVLASGTVIGFAAMNTLGNAIAGIILMISRPFKIGDRVYFDGKFADVEEIDLIYTRMKTTDNIKISIPNQKLIQTEIEDYGKARIVRRRHAITAGYEEPPEKIESALLEAASKVKGILNEPKPYVWITEFQNFAVEYTLFVFIRNLKRILEIDSAVRKSILEYCNRQGIDISTPSLIRSLKD
jgi:small conductance mechanosensitive channel